MKYSREAFEKVKEDVATYLRSIKFDKPVAYVPISAYDNENLTSISQRIGWYKGKPLFEVVSDFAEKHSKRARRNKGLRIVVQDSIDMEGRKAFFGVLCNGAVKADETVWVEPEGIKAKVERVYVKGKKVKSAKEGMNVALMFGKEPKIGKGSIIYDVKERPHRKGSFEAKVFIIKNIDSKEAKRFEIKTNNHSIALKSMRINRIFSPISGESSRPSSSAAKANNVIYANIDLASPYPLEKYSEYNELGRFAIYDKDVFVGVGIVE